MLYKYQGQYAQAEPLLLRALSIREKALGPEHREVAASLNNLATIYHALEKKDTKQVAIALQVNPFFINQYKIAANNYNKEQLFYIFECLKEYDLRSKGVNNKSTNQEGLLKELIFKILHS